MSDLEKALVAACRAFVNSYVAKPQEINAGVPLPTPAQSENGIGSHCGKQLMKSKFCKDGFEAYYWCGECKKNFNKDFTPAPYRKRA